MYPNLTPRLVSSEVLIVPSLLSSRMLKTDLLAMASRLQFFVQPPDVQGVEQAAVVHGVVQPVVVQATLHDLPLREE